MSDFKLVPASILLDKETIGSINFHCGDGADGQFGEYSDGLLWVGTVTDDDGKEVHGLHLATAEYPEEGSTTLVEFEALSEESGVDFGIDGRSVRVSQEAYSIFLAREAAAREKIDALQLRLKAADQQIDELTAQQAESRVITLSGCEFSEHELIRTAVRMVTGTSRRGTQRWVAMKDAFCCGSGVAHALCRRFGFDPDETVKP